MMEQVNIIILYLCDREACEYCSNECKHTSDITHAIHKDTLSCSLFECDYTNRDILFIEKEMDRDERVG